MSDTHQKRGGDARARNLSSETRSLIAKQAAQARWAKINDPNALPEAESDGILQIGDIGIDVYLLKDHRRLLSKKSLAQVLGLKSEGGNAFMRTMTRPKLRSGLTEKLALRLENPIFFKGLKGDLIDGYEAEDLIDICNALIAARRENRLNKWTPAMAAELTDRIWSWEEIVQAMDAGVPSKKRGH